MKRSSETKSWKSHHGRLLDCVEGFDVIDCETCAFKHTIPLPGNGELEHRYRNDYYTRDKPLYLDRHREDLDWWRLAYSERYDSFETALPPERRRILDVGSGPGYFLETGRDRGWDTLGIEPSKQAAAHTRSLGLTVVEDTFSETSAGQLGQFDVVHLSEVLEHIPNPREFLGWIRRILLPGGLICVVVPNDYNPVQSALRDVCGFEPWWIAPPSHLNYFDFESLSTLLATAGFDPLLKEGTFPIDLFLLMGDNYVGNDGVGRECHRKRKRLESNLAAAGLTNWKREVYQKLGECGLGREILMIARKNEAPSDPTPDPVQHPTSS